MIVLRQIKLVSHRRSNLSDFLHSPRKNVRIMLENNLTEFSLTLLKNTREKISPISIPYEYVKKKNIRKNFINPTVSP